MIIRTHTNAELSVADWTKQYDLRSCIIPPPGKLFLQSDWSQVEVVALATVLDALLQRTSNLTKIINGTVCINGTHYPNDVHTMLAALILEEPYEVIYLQRKDVKRIIDARQMAKAAVFGLPGGMGVRTFMTFAQDAYGVFLTIKQAQRLKRLWYQLLGEDMYEYFDYIETMWDKQITQLVSKRVRSGLTYCAAANTLFQGLAADAAKYTMCAIEWAAETEPDEFQTLLPGLRSLGLLKTVNYQLNQFIHDEFIGIADDPGGDLKVLMDAFIEAHSYVQKDWNRLQEIADSKKYPVVCLALIEKGLLMIDCAQYYFRGLEVREESQLLRRWGK